MLVIYHFFFASSPCIETASVVTAKCIYASLSLSLSDLTCEDTTSLHSAVHLTSGGDLGGRHTSCVQWRVRARRSKKPARKQVDDVTHLAASEQQLVYTYLRQSTTRYNIPSSRFSFLHTISNLHTMFSTKAISLRALSRAPCQVGRPAARRLYATDHEQRTQETLKTSSRLTW
jgi:hypothetical protein